jgi:putative drug exporter of the RND superfamily
MHRLLRFITDKVTTRKGMWVTLGIWFLAALLLGGLAPSAKDYEVSSIDSIPSDAQSVIAQQKVDRYFAANEGIPAILVFQSQAEGDESRLAPAQLAPFLSKLPAVEGVKEWVPIAELPPQAADAFISEDRSTVILPLLFDSSLETAELRTAQEEIQAFAEEEQGLTLYITGPAGIAVDSLNLFSRADIVLLLSTVGLVLILLIVIYRSPLLALIPLLAVAFVYEVVNQSLGLMGQAGLVMSNQTLSIMMILLFAAVVDYSLFVFSRYREELKRHDDKYIAMREAMRETGLPVFYSGGTVLAAMLVLFFAEFGDYRNFAPTFGTAMAVIMIASVTLVPALFTLFGRRSFWPKVPKVGDATVRASSAWSRIGRAVVRKPVLAVTAIGLILLLSASNMFNLKYEFDTIKSFPEDMPSRQGYEVLEEKFEKGDLAQTTVLVEAQEPISDAQQEQLVKTLTEQPLVGSVRPNGSAEEGKVLQLSLTFHDNPYAVETMDAMETMIAKSDSLLEDSGVSGEMYFAGETAKKVDDRAINNRDLVVIVILESVLILGMLIVLTRSIKMPLYMMGTILLSFLAAVGLGMFLSGLFFDIHAVSNRVPLYSFVFLVALGIDYNIILISRFMEERKHHPVKQAIEMAVAATGGVISSAGIILAVTFAVLMTQPIEVLFVFGFIVAVGIVLDTFLIRGVLLPALVVLFERDKPATAKGDARPVK